MINENLADGRTDKCETFDNELLTDSKEFQIANIEVFLFI